LEKVIVRTGRKVLTKVDNNNLLIVGYQQGIIEQQFMPHPIYVVNIIVLNNLLYY